MVEGFERQQKLDRGIGRQRNLCTVTASYGQVNTFIDDVIASTSSHFCCFRSSKAQTFI